MRLARLWLLVLLFVTTLAPNAIPGSAATLEQSNPIYGYTRLWLPMLRKEVPAEPPPPPPAPRVAAWLEVPSAVEVDDLLEVVVNVRNNIGGSAAENVTIIMPYSGKQYRLIDARFNDGRDWIRENNYPGDLTIQFGRVAPGDQRSGRLFFELNRDTTNGGLAVGNSTRVRGRFSPGAALCGADFCQMNDVRVDVVAEGSNEDDDGSNEIGLGSGAAGTEFRFTATGYIPGEQIVTWLNSSTGTRPSELTQQADSAGNAYFRFTTFGLTADYYSLVAHGQYSGREVVGRFQITSALMQNRQFSAGSAGIQWLPSLHTAAPAQAAFEVTPAQASGLGVIQGAVGANGTRLEGVLVSAVAADGSVIDSDSSDGLGGFRLLGLPTGVYTVTFEPRFSYNLTATNYLYGELLGVAVTSPGVTSISKNLDPAASVSGTVSGAGAGGLNDVSVLLLNGDELVSSTTTNSSGAYTLDGVPGGSYTLRFDPTRSTVEATRVYSPTETSISVIASTPLNNQNVTLERTVSTGTISGRVGTTSTSLSQVYVIIRKRNPITDNYEFADLALTRADGSYTSGQLEAGSYKVEFVPSFSPNENTRRYLDEYYSDRADLQSAAVIELASNENKSGINGTLARGSTIAGTLTAADTGAGLRDVLVLISRDGEIEALAFTDSTGAYRTSGLSAGEYTVSFITAYAAEPTANYASITLPDQLIVIGSDLAGVDRALGLGGAISGTVRGEGNAPLGGLIVYAIDPVALDDPNDDRIKDLAITDANGFYTLRGLPEGEYAVEYITFLSDNPDLLAYRTEFYNDKPTIEAADLVPVTVGSIFSNIDATLARGGQIRGRVTDGAGRGVAGVFVRIEASGGALEGYATTLEDGSYATTPLANGQYTVVFDPTFDFDLRGRSRVTYPQPVDVNGTTPVTGIDMVLN
jgi:hypothetical protein